MLAPGQSPPPAPRARYPGDRRCDTTSEDDSHDLSAELRALRDKYHSSGEADSDGQEVLDAGSCKRISDERISTAAAAACKDGALSEGKMNVVRDIPSAAVVSMGKVNPERPVWPSSNGQECGLPAVPAVTPLGCGGAGSTAVSLPSELSCSELCIATSLQDVPFSCRSSEGLSPAEASAPNGEAASNKAPNEPLPAADSNVAAGGASQLNSSCCGARSPGTDDINIQRRDGDGCLEAAEQVAQDGSPSQELSIFVESDLER